MAQSTGGPDQPSGWSGPPVVPLHGWSCGAQSAGGPDQPSGWSGPPVVLVKTTGGLVVLNPPAVPTSNPELTKEIQQRVAAAIEGVDNPPEASCIENGGEWRGDATTKLLVSCVKI